MSQYFAALFSRRPNDGWFRVSRFDITTVDILTAAAIFSMFLSLWPIRNVLPVWDLLPYDNTGIRSGEIWRLVTWPIAEFAGFFPIIGVAFFWSFGQQLEGLFGKGKFLVWTLAVTLIPAVAMALIGLAGNSFDLSGPDFGLGLLFLAGIWVYAGTYPNVRWFDVIPIWAIAAVFTLLRIAAYGPAGSLFVVIAIVTALSVGRTLGFATAWPIPHIPIGGGTGGGRQKRTKPTPPKRPKRGGAGQRVVEGPWRREPEASAPKVVPPIGPSPADQAEMDGLLDKISDEGMDALSGAEKQRLNELSKRLRNR
ncbi:MAG: DUF6576 domain-containing protein [Ilumatobacter sp.]|uniref:DUF6576 domain-containing protein n=1 Tax=Ilumatobacter sp. TaxID=1967498 RepID=UPI003C728CC9